ncbi:MAG: ribose transport system permease protein [Mycobacterium sp.]|nr:ribose transport system permease protein [Mycobacterium sp.]
MTQMPTIEPQRVWSPRAVARTTIEPRLLLLAGVLVGLVVLFSVLAPGFGSPANLADVLRQNVTLVVVAVGLTFVLLAGELDLSVGAITALVSVLVAQSVTAWGLPVVPAVLLGLVVGTGLGAVNALLVLGLKIPSFLSTLAILGVVQGLALTVSLSAVDVAGRLGAAFAGSIVGMPVVILYGALVAVVASVMLSRSRFGLWLRATGSDQEMARLVGLSVARHRAAVFAISGLCAGIGGVIVVGRTGFGDALSMPGLGIDALAAVILGGTRLGGGRGSIAGTVLAAVLIGFLASGIQAVGLPSSGQDIVRGVVIGAAVLLMRPPRRKEAIA